MEHYLRLAAAGGFDLTALVTHHFRLEQYREAFLMMHAKSRHCAVKAVFDLDAA